MNWSEKAFQQGVIGLKKSLDKAVEKSLTERGYKKMKKIQLTQEQKDRIDFILSDWEPPVNSTIEEILLRTHENRWKETQNRCLNDLSLDSFARVLYTPNSYEVIPQFKVGDWVIFEYKAVRVIGEILEIETDEFFTAKVDDPKYQVPQNIALSKLRHATPEEIQQEKKRRFWDKLGREVDEYKHGDLFTFENSTQFRRVVEKIGYNAIIDGNGVEFLIENIRLVVPVEQRLDK